MPEAGPAPAQWRPTLGPSAGEDTRGTFSSIDGARDKMLAGLGRFAGRLGLACHWSPFPGVANPRVSALRSCANDGL